MSKTLVQRVDDHMRNDETFQRETKEDIHDVKEDIRGIHIEITTIRENHLFHIEKDIAEVKGSNKVQTWILGVVATAMVAGVIKVVFFP